jgi:8-oxo-dGTP pyrophosphatase MutT (NUDIX family)
MNANYARWLREHVGHEPVFLNAASAIIVDNSGKILLQRRGEGESSNSWSLPGGIMELGERSQETVRREVKEETGLDVEIGRFVGVYATPELVYYPNSDACQMVTQVFECKIIGGKLKADGHETLELVYFDLKDRPKLFRPHLERALGDFESGRFGNSY